MKPKWIDSPTFQSGKRPPAISMDCWRNPLFFRYRECLIWRRDSAQVLADGAASAGILKAKSAILDANLCAIFADSDDLEQLVVGQRSRLAGPLNQVSGACAPQKIHTTGMDARESL